MYSTRYLRDFPLLKIMGQFVNIIYVYKLLKKYQGIKYFVSLSRLQSRITGYVCKMYMPVCLRSLFYGLFSVIYGVKIQEATKPYHEYPNFTDFFTRCLKPGIRPIYREVDKYSLSSPCDGTVLSSGLIDSASSTIDCVKGRSYRLDEFMIGVIGDDGDQDTASRVVKV